MTFLKDPYPQSETPEVIFTGRCGLTGEKFGIFLVNMIIIFLLHKHIRPQDLETTASRSLSPS